MARRPLFARATSWSDTAACALIAAIVGAWRLPLNSLGNPYYAAAAKTGAHSLRALFFATFDPSGIMAVDKPPLGLVGPALAIRWFGLSSWTVLLPQVAMFAAGVAVLHRAMRRWSSRIAAALCAAIVISTPVEVAVARSNNPDALLVLLTIAGLVLLVEAVRRDHLAWTVSAAAIVGLAFTTKQLQAVVAAPAAVGALAFLSQGSWRRKALRVVAYVVVAAATSALWIVAVDTVAPSQRPYVANSVDDSERELALGFNGAHRIEQLRKDTSPSARRTTRTTGSTRATGSTARPPATERPPAEPRRDLASGAFVTQGTWLLIAATATASFALITRQVRQRRELQVLLGWTIVHALALAYAPGKFSAYYLAPLVPGLAIVTAMSVDSFLPGRVTSDDPDASGPPHAEGLFVLLASVVAVDVVTISDVAVRNATLAAAAAAVAAASLARRLQRAAPLVRRASNVGVILLSTIALLLVPARWTYADITHPQNTVAPEATLSRPAVSTQERLIRSNDGHLLRYVETTSTTPLTFATTRIGIASTAILDGFAPAPLGGYFGTDQRPSLRAVQRWIRTARLRWIAVPDLPPLHFGAPSLPPGVIAAPWGPWARAHCTAVPRAVWGGIDTKAFWRRYGHMPLHTPLDLYDCAGATSAG